MAAEGWGTNPSLDQPEIRRLLDGAPYRFEFFQAVRLLEYLSGSGSTVGHFVPPPAEAVRFAANPSSAFPASDIQSLEAGQSPPKMTVNFIGLTGPNGVLPIVYDELLQELENDEKPKRQRFDRAAALGTTVGPRPEWKDEVLRAFLDIFNHRITALFYRAWTKHRFETNVEKGESDPLSRCLMSLIGMGTPRLENRQDVPDDALLFFSGLLAPHRRSAAAFEELLTEYFGVPIEIEQFVGRWRKLDPSAHTRLNETARPQEKLGYGALAGDEVWDPQSGVRIKVGPLSTDQYLAFLPDGSAYKELRALTRFYAGDAMDFEAQLILKRDEVRSCELGSADKAGPRLGWITWMKTTSREAPFDRDPADAIFSLS